MPDWLYISLRALLLVLLAYTAYVGIRRFRTQTRRWGPYDWLSLALGLPILSGWLVILVYGLVTEWPGYVLALAMILYIAVGFYLFMKLLRWLEKRFPPVPPVPATPGQVSPTSQVGKE